jgi:hypothetical protein
MIAQYDFFRTKYGEELLIDLMAVSSSRQTTEAYICFTRVSREQQTTNKMIIPEIIIASGKPHLKVEPRSSIRTGHI